MPFADFHVHGNFKSFFTALEVAKKKSPWDHIKVGVDKLLGNRHDRIFESQSCFTQILNGDLQIAVMPLYSLEFAFADSFKLKFVDVTTNVIAKGFFKGIREGSITYYQQLLDSYAHLERAKTDNALKSNIVNFTKRYSDLKPGHINIILSMEGAHCFLEDADEPVTPSGMKAIETRIMQYKSKAADNPFPRVFIINLTHLSQAPFSNHAFGIKFLPHEEFAPNAKGLSPAGLRLIDVLMSHDEGHYPILIDVKHMSLESRKEYYEIRRAKFPKLPIVASHIACTGISYTKVNDYITEIRTPLLNKRRCNLISYEKPRGIVPNTEFNPWSINMYDEDIVQILQSGGILGISLDQRVLGVGKLAREKMSRGETFRGIIPIMPYYAEDPDEEHEIHDAQLHFRHLCNNIFHIAHIALKTLGPEEQWTRIVIGSDFDGLIDAVDFCTNAEQYKNIEDYLRRYLVDIAKEARIQLPKEVDALIQGFMYENGRAFLEKYYVDDY